MDCCQIEGIELNFDRKKAAAKLDKYRRKGPQKTTRILVNALRAKNILEHTLLDIGGGIGAIQHELLRAGIPRATDFEASAAYIEACKEEADRLGHADQITHIHGDFADFGDEIPAADIVTLERVICCYHDMPGLLNQACTKTRRLLGLVFPYDTIWVTVAMKIFNLKFRLKRIPFRYFTHPTSEVNRVVHNHGFEQRFYQRTGTWQVILYERTRA